MWIYDTSIKKANETICRYYRISLRELEDARDQINTNEEQMNEWSNRMNEWINECDLCWSKNSTFIAQIYENNNLFEQRMIQADDDEIHIRT